MSWSGLGWLCGEYSGLCRDDDHGDEHKVEPARGSAKETRSSFGRTKKAVAAPVRGGRPAGDAQKLKSPDEGVRMPTMWSVF